MSLYTEVTSIYRTTELAINADDLLDIYVAAQECGGVAYDVLPTDSKQARDSVIAAHVGDLQLKNSYYGWELSQRAANVKWAVENGARIVELVVRSETVDGGPNLEAFRDILYSKRKITELHNALAG